MICATTRLLLRPPASTDAVSLFEIYGDPRTNIYNPFGPYPDIERARAALGGWIDHWARHGFGWWAIATAADPAVVIGYGGVGYRQYGSRSVLDLGYRFRAEAWGNGYATELGRAALELAFGEQGQSEVVALVRPRNLPSIHVLEKLGMTRFDTLDDVPGETPSLIYRIAAP